METLQAGFFLIHACLWLTSFQDLIWSAGGAMELAWIWKPFLATDSTAVHAALELKEALPSNISMGPYKSYELNTLRPVFKIIAVTHQTATRPVQSVAVKCVIWLVILKTISEH